MPGLRSAEDQIQDCVHARQALYRLSYIPRPEEFFQEGNCEGKRWAFCHLGEKGLSWEERW